MVSAPTLLQSVQSAFSAATAPRGMALALLRGAFLSGPSAATLGKLEIPASIAPLPPDYARAWRQLNFPRQQPRELDLADALARHADAEAILLLAALVRLPPPAAERAVLGPDNDALLLLGRAANLAWSTMRSLVAMRERLLTATVPREGELTALGAIAVSFDEFPRPVAERALRFIRAFATASVMANDRYWTR